MQIIKLLATAAVIGGFIFVMPKSAAAGPLPIGAGMHNWQSTDNIIEPVGYRHRHHHYYDDDDDYYDDGYAYNSCGGGYGSYDCPGNVYVAPLYVAPVVPYVYAPYRKHHRHHYRHYRHHYGY
jgi:hypothetical protein